MFNIKDYHNLLEENCSLISYIRHLKDIIRQQRRTINENNQLISKLNNDKNELINKLMNEKNIFHLIDEIDNLDLDEVCPPPKRIIKLHEDCDVDRRLAALEQTMSLIASFYEKEKDGNKTVNE